MLVSGYKDFVLVSYVLKVHSDINSSLLKQLRQRVLSLEDTAKVLV